MNILRRMATTSTKWPSGFRGCVLTPMQRVGNTNSFSGSGEFTLELGDYVVRITVPEDHIVASTGTLLNPDQVLTEAQRERLESAQDAEEPGLYRHAGGSQRKRSRSRPTGTKTWIFKADQVRDFAFASSRKFIWDAMQHNVGDFPVMAMSYYPNEAEPLWSRYSTHAIIHTLNVYSRYTFDYPYPGGDLGQRSGRRNGISHDLFQRPATRKRWNLFGADQIRFDLRDHSRSRSQLLSR